MKEWKSRAYFNLLFTNINISDKTFELLSAWGKYELYFLLTSCLVFFSSTFWLYIYFSNSILFFYLTLCVLKTKFKPEMAYKSFSCDINRLTGINERFDDHEELKSFGFDLLKIISFQGWEWHFDMLWSPIYPVLVKEFWVNASVNDIIRDPSIQSNVFGFPITIITPVIAKSIKCDDNGVAPDFFSFNVPHLHHFLHKIFKDLSHTLHTSNIFSEAYIWHQGPYANFNPLIKYSDLVTLEDDNTKKIHRIFGLTSMN